MHPGGPGTPISTCKLCKKSALGSLVASPTALLTDWEGCAAKNQDALSHQVCDKKCYSTSSHFPKPFHIYIYLILFWEPPANNRAKVITH